MRKGTWAIPRWGGWSRPEAGVCMVRGDEGTLSGTSPRECGWWGESGEEVVGIREEQGIISFRAL